MSEMEYANTLLAAATRTYLYIEPHLVAISPEAPSVALQLCRPEFVNEEEGEGLYLTYHANGLPYAISAITPNRVRR